MKKRTGPEWTILAFTIAAIAGVTWFWQIKRTEEPVASALEQSGDAPSVGLGVERAAPESANLTQRRPAEGGSPVSVLTASFKRTLVSVSLVCHESGEVVTRGTVEAQLIGKKASIKSARVSDAGIAEIPLTVGAYAFTVKPNSLPKGLIPPPLQGKHRQVYWEGLHSPQIEIDGSTPTASVVLPVRQAAHVSGYVTVEGGPPLPGLAVRISSDRKRVPGTKVDVPINSDGFYEAYLAPGDYRLQPTMLGTREALGGIPLLPPTFFTLQPAESVTQDFPMAKGPCTIRGVLTDPALTPGEDDIFWEGLQVLAKAYSSEEDLDPDRMGMPYAHALGGTRTDADGVFEITGLEPGTYQLIFAPYAAAHDPNKRDCLLAAHVKPMVVTIDGPGVFDVGSTLAPRTRVCEVVGRVVSDVEYRYLSIMVTNPKVHEEQKEHTKAVRVKSDGTFAFWVHTSPTQAPAKLRLGIKSRPEQDVLREFEVPPHGHQVLELRYP